MLWGTKKDRRFCLKSTERVNIDAKTAGVAVITCPELDYDAVGQAHD